MDPASLLVGLAIGILATCTGSFIIVWQLIRRAPRIEGIDGRRLYVLPGQTGTSDPDVIGQRWQQLVDELPDGRLTLPPTAVPWTETTNEIMRDLEGPR